jgi:hypothetical protein
MFGYDPRLAQLGLQAVFILALPTHVGILFGLALSKLFGLLADRVPRHPKARKRFQPNQ